MPNLSIHNRDARRESARRRFKIQNMVEWAKQRKLGGHIDRHKPAYEDYIARKEVEKKALGL